MVSESEAGSDRVRPDRGEPDGDGARIAALLSEVADDPAAPPSSVTAMSVIAAAKAAAKAEPATSLSAPPVDTVDPAEKESSAPTGELIEFRPRRRRFALAGLVAAASLAGLSALVISLTVTGGSSTSTSADGARAASAEIASSPDSPAAADLAPAPAAGGSAGELNPPREQEAAGAPGDASVAAGASAAAGSGPAADTVAAGCWPELSDPALAALTDALPPGAYGPPQSLTADCEPGAVGGALLPGTADGTVLVVRVSAAAPGACVSDTNNGTACVAKGNDVYVASDESGSRVVYVYGNGRQVVVSGWPASGDSVAIASGLNAEQSVTAAEAVLGAVG